MDKKKLLIIIFSLLLFLTGVLILSRTFWSQLPEFAVKNPDKINRIIFKSNTGNVKLQKQKGTWILNNTEVARMDAVNALIKILTDLEVKSPIDKNTLSEVILDPDTEEVRVSVKSSLRTLKEYSVYKVSTNPYGNVMTKEGKANYIMHVPGYNGNIGVFYSTKTNYWKPHTIFNYKASDILSVEFINANEPQSSFRITKNETGLYILEKLDSMLVVENADQAQITRYLSYYHSIGFEKFIDSDINLSNSILKEPALYTIKVKDIQNEEKRIKIFPVYVGKDSTRIDNNLAYASLSWEKDIVLVKFFTLDPLIKGMEYFTR